MRTFLMGLGQVAKPTLNDKPIWGVRAIAVGPAAPQLQIAVVQSKPQLTPSCLVAIT